jgi:hypothetical protein
VRRTLVLAAVGTLAISGIGYAAWRVMFRGGAPRVQSVVVVETRGEVLIERGREPARPAKVGERLHRADRVTTGTAGRVRLRLADGSRVVLEEGSSFRVGALGTEVAAFRLGKGVVAADVVVDSSRTFRLDAPAGTRAETRGGRFEVGGDPETGTQVAAQEGSVTVAAGGAEVELGAGQETRVAPGGRPEEPTAIPRSVFLKVRWPGSVVPSDRALVRGETNPGAIVRIGESTTRADREGRFQTQVELGAGENHLTVTARAPGVGRAEESSGPITVDTTPPPVSAETGNLWR